MTRSTPPDVPSSAGGARRNPVPMSLGMLAICLGVLTAGATVDVSPERAELCGIELPAT